jgi:hypothetical protein
MSIHLSQTKLAAVIEKIPELRAVLSELFLGSIDVGIEGDPEIPDKQYVVFVVHAEGEVKEIAKRRREWYNHTSGLLGCEAELVQLVVTVS